MTRNLWLIVIGTVCGFLLIVLIVIGALSGEGGQGDSQTAAQQQQSTSEGGGEETSAEPEPEPEANPTFEMGATATNGVVDITVSDAEFTSEAPDQYSEPPYEAYFLTVNVEMVNNGDTSLDVNPVNWYAKHDGYRFGVGEGNAMFMMSDRRLAATTLSAGERIQGTLTFDVPAKSGSIVWSPGFVDDRPRAIWQYG